MTRLRYQSAAYDTLLLIEGSHRTPAMYARVQAALVAAAAVYRGGACFTRVGAEYLGVPFAGHIPFRSRGYPPVENPVDDIEADRA